MNYIPYWYSGARLVQCSSNCSAMQCCPNFKICLCEINILLIFELILFISSLPYKGLFGGAGSFTRAHFELINGFSNVFWGWGGEDDDLFQR